MAARIPHLLTRLLSSDELDALKGEFLRQAESAGNGPATLAWMDAAILLEKTRNESLQHRSQQTPSARRKSLGRRYTR